MTELRYRFKATLEALTPLRIGDGGVAKDRILLRDVDGKPQTAEVATVFIGKGSKPYLPGTSVKGWLRALAEPRLDQDCFQRLFGYQKPGARDEMAPGCGGLVRFSNAMHVADPAGFELARQPGADVRKFGEYWSPDRHTCVASHVVIDRNTKTAARKLLFFEEFVPAGSTFSLTFDLIRPSAEVDRQAFERDAACFLALLKLFEPAAGGPARLGAATVDDWGRVQLSDVTSSAIDADGLRRWLLNGQIATPLPWRPAALIPAVLALHDVSHLSFPIEIDFEGAFICNDPSRARKEEDTNDEASPANFEPIRLPQNRPYLPHSALRGSLRSQAEKIQRTRRFIVATPSVQAGREGSLPIVQSTEDCGALDSVSLLFGAPGIRSALAFSNQSVVEPGEIVVQELVGLDRFTSAVGKRKFKARYFWQPKLKLDVVIDLETLRWAATDTDHPNYAEDRIRESLILLAQTLRDLAEGFIPLGFGAAKGWGRCQATIGPATSGLDALPLGTPLRAFFEHGFVPRPLPKLDITEDVNHAPGEVPAAADHFFNPYHFHPVSAPANGPTVPKLSELEARTGTKLTLDRYHEGLYTGYLDCLLTTETPLAIGAKHTPHPDAPTEVELFKRKVSGVEQIAIPATSLRGMVSSHFEALTNSALRVLDNEHYSVRKRIDQGLSAIGVVLCFNAKKGHWSPADKGNRSWYIKPLCLPTYHVISKPLDKAWSSLFPVNPVLKQYVGNNQKEIGNDAWVAANPTWTPGGAIVPLNVRSLLSWAGPNDVTPIAAVHRRDEFRLSIEQGVLPQTGVRRTLGCNGGRQMPVGKKHELLIPAPNLNAVYLAATPGTAGLVELPESVVANFERVAKQMTDLWRPPDGLDVRPYEPAGTRATRIASGKAVPLTLQGGDLVYFDIEGSAAALRVKEISFSSIWRKAVPKYAFEFFAAISPDLLPMSDVRLQGRDESTIPVTPAEKLFGFVEVRKEKNPNEPLKAFASRLRFTDGIYELNLGPDPCYANARKLKILGSPKPPSPALYFSDMHPANVSQYIEKTDLGEDTRELRDHTHVPTQVPTNQRPKGRKFYLHHTIAAENFDSANAPWCAANQNNGQEHDDQRMRVKLVKKGAKFRFRIYFENLSPEDLNILYTVLRPHAESRYKLGLGRPLGLGTVRIDRSGVAFAADMNKRYDPIRLNETAENHAQQIQLSSGDLAGGSLEALTDKAYSNVSYPQVTRYFHQALAPLDGESKLYEWFVANDAGSGGNSNPTKRWARNVSMQVQPDAEEVSPLPVLPYTVPLHEE